MEPVSFGSSSPQELQLTFSKRRLVMIWGMETINRDKRWQHEGKKRRLRQNRFKVSEGLLNFLLYRFSTNTYYVYAELA